VPGNEQLINENLCTKSTNLYDNDKKALEFFFTFQQDRSYKELEGDHKLLKYYLVEIQGNPKRTLDNLMYFIFGKLGFNTYPFAQLFEHDFKIEVELMENYTTDFGGRIELTILDLTTKKFIFINENKSTKNCNLTDSKCQIAAEMY
jgi:hypothetical protein